MYFDEVDCALWKFNVALAKFKVKYSDNTLVIQKMQQVLYKTSNNPNIKKCAKNTCLRMLKRKEFNNVNAIKIGDNSTAQQSSSSSTSATYNAERDIYLNSTVNNIAGSSKRGTKRKIDSINPPTDEVDLFFKDVQTDESNDLNSSDAPLFLKLQKTIKLMHPTEEWIIGSFRVTQKLLQYQEYCMKAANDQGFVLETHAHEVVMLSSCLLLKPNQYSDALRYFFTIDELNTIRNNVLDSLCGSNYEDIEFNQKTMDAIIPIIKKLVKKRITRSTAQFELFCLAHGLDDSLGHEVAIIHSLIDLIKKLPAVEINEPLGEIELCCNYADPALSSLFTDHDKKTKLTWPNLIQKESKISDSNVNTSRRPDAVMRVISQHSYAESRGYGELKTKERRYEVYELVRDLVRCCIFSKESIDISDIPANMCFQMVGERISFSVETLFKDGVYPFVEIASIKAPMSLEDLPSYLTYFDDLMKVLNIYDFCSKNDTITINAKHKRPTLESPAFNNYLDKNKSKFNKSSLVF